jgi:hypothetical protein
MHQADYRALPISPGHGIFSGMTKLLDKALEVVRRLPPRSQDEVAHAMLTLAGNEREPEAIDDEIEAAFRRFDP